MTISTLPRMRTLAQLAAHYKALDNDTAVTAHFLRAKVLTGEIPCVMAGSKRLVAIEAVDAYLSGKLSPTEQIPQQGVIRRIS